ncbi:unnamed protein product [Merluccius merluccius]
MRTCDWFDGTPGSSVARLRLVLLVGRGKWAGPLVLLPPLGFLVFVFVTAVFFLFLLPVLPPPVKHTAVTEGCGRVTSVDLFPCKPGKRDSPEEQEQQGETGPSARGPGPELRTSKGTDNNNNNNK